MVYTADLEKYNDVQNLWEEYMAQAIADYLSSWEGKDKKFWPLLETVI